MEITASRFSPDTLSFSALLVTVFEEDSPADRLNRFASDIDRALGGSIFKLMEAGSVTGKFKEFTILHPEKIPVAHLILLGCGKKKDFNPDRFRSIVAKAARISRRARAAELAVPTGGLVSLEPEESGLAAAEGTILGLYRFTKYKSKKPGEKNAGGDALPSKLSLLADGDPTPVEAGARRGRVIAEAACLARDLVNEPSNVLTPIAFAEQAKAVSEAGGIEIRILDREQIEGLKMGGLLGVAQGSSEPPRLVVMKYKGDPGSAFCLGLVGKGVTFDSGGISIKPAENMQAMTSDMAGAAACLGAMKAVAGLKLPLNVTAVLPLAENLPDGKAYKPGDIVTSYAGKTIEIINTDAEGRMLLCDALAYIRTMDVSAIVDLATLTGAVIVALGGSVAGLFSNHEKLAEAIFKAGERASETFWRMPLFEAYSNMMKGSQADLKNSGGRYAGACTAAAFLKEFVGDTPWAHLDIAGTALVESDKTLYQEHPYFPKSGATGFGVRTLAFLAEELARRKSL